MVDADPLGAIADIQILQRAQAVFAEGDDASHVYCVASGMIRLYKLLPDGRRQIVGFLQAGDMMGLAVRGQYLYTAEAVTVSTVQRIPRARLDALLDRLPALVRRLHALTAGDLVAAQDQMLLLGRKTALEKVASFLLMLAKRRSDATRCLPLPMPRGDIADYLGLTLETVSRTFTKLRTSGLIRLLDDNMVELTNH
jgi:CRP/FNR family transcriptional regulator